MVMDQHAMRSYLDEAAAAGQGERNYLAEVAAASCMHGIALNAAVLGAPPCIHFASATSSR
jgi:hypothetical protein